MNNLEKAKTSFRWGKEMRWDKHCSEVIANNEGNVKQNIISL